MSDPGRTATFRLTLLDGSTWTEQGIKDFALWLEDALDMKADAAKPPDGWLLEAIAEELNAHGLGPHNGLGEECRAGDVLGRVRDILKEEVRA